MAAAELADAHDYFLLVPEPMCCIGCLPSDAEGMARMAEVVGVDHVGLGGDMLGLTVPSVFDSYAELPDLARALLALFNPEEVQKLLGGNYARVFAASVG
jgi:membrane dipeptidase